MAARKRPPPSKAVLFCTMVKEILQHRVTGSSQFVSGKHESSLDLESSDLGDNY